MRTIERTTLLDWALLGLLHQGPQAGYDLRRTFSSTPIAHFSDSPGTIYPALRRLERRGLIEPVPGEPGSGRRRRPLRLTRSGEAALVEWLGVLPTRADVERDMDGLILRLGFMSQALPVASVRLYLDALAVSVKEHLAGLEQFFAEAGPHMPLSARLAFESGVEAFRAYAVWLKRARRQLRTHAQTERQRT